MELLAYFINGSLMSLGHCVGMCGGIVLAYCQSKFNPTTSLKQQILGHALYSLGRISMYVLVGILASLGFRGFLEWASHVWDLDRTHLQAIIFIVMGVLMVGFALGYTLRLKANLGMGFLKSLFRATLGAPKISSLYVLGLINGLLPCFMVYWFVLSALAQPNAMRSLEVLLTLGLATFLPMFVFGLLLGRFLNSALRALFMKLAFLMMLGFGGYNIYMGVVMLQGHAHHMHMGH
ncbi:membrane protein, putative [Helicobacter bizzozeronii CIII-1]|uniref:Membrane protein, putative n=2 Tax=Helicobacter bizzozeronii TaxID=56877 RepID=F8KPV0_HELBC|nr:membrane protein, putative [Helicobacter bizzozeronii CIII-1]